MKKLILSLMLAAFAVAVQAGEGTSCNKETATCSKAKAEQAKSCCSASAGKVASGSCPMAKEKAKETAAKPLKSPKANS